MYTILQYGGGQNLQLVTILVIWQQKVPASNGGPQNPFCPVVTRLLVRARSHLRRPLGRHKTKTCIQPGLAVIQQVDKL